MYGIARRIALIGVTSVVVACFATACDSNPPRSSSASAPASPAISASATPLGAAPVVVGRNYSFEAPAGWIALPHVDTWNIANLPTDATAGVERVYNPGVEHETVAIGEHRLAASATLHGWITELASRGATRYQKYCGHVQVTTTRATVAGVPASIDAFACPTYSAVVATVATIHDGDALLITCDSSARSVNQEQQACRQLLITLKFRH